MTLYKVLKTTQNALDIGWSIHFPDGHEETLEFFGIAVDWILSEDPTLLTAEVTHIEMNASGYMEVWTQKGVEYCPQLKSILEGDKDEVTIDEAISWLGLNAKHKWDITLSECDSVAEIADCTIYEVVEHLGYKTL